jgi:hypothetical protein
MSHLNTAYKLGSIQAQVEFEDWLRKQGGMPGENVPPAPVATTAEHAAKSPRAVVNPGPAASNAARTNTLMAQNQYRGPK